MRLRIYYLWILLVVTQLAAFEVNATHVRGGEITFSRISNITLTYEITIIGHRDQDSSIEFGGAGIIDFGDGDEQNALFKLLLKVSEMELKRLHSRSPIPIPKPVLLVICLVTQKSLGITIL